MSEEYKERFSNLAVIAMHYPEIFELDKMCEAFVKAHPRRLFQTTLFEKSVARGVLGCP